MSGIICQCLRPTRTSCCGCPDYFEYQEPQLSIEEGLVIMVDVVEKHMPELVGKTTKGRIYLDFYEALKKVKGD